MDKEKSKNHSKLGQPFMRNAVASVEKRKRDLENRRKELTDRVSMMERLIPSMTVLDLLDADYDHPEDGPAAAVERVRKMMKNLAPQPDLADELLSDINARIEELNREENQLNVRQFFGLVFVTAYYNDTMTSELEIMMDGVKKRFSNILITSFFGLF